MSDITTGLASYLAQEAAEEAAERIHHARVDWLATMGSDEEPAAFRKFRQALDEAP